MPPFPIRKTYQLASAARTAHLNGAHLSIILKAPTGLVLQIHLPGRRSRHSYSHFVGKSRLFHVFFRRRVVHVAIFKVRANPALGRAWLL